MRHLDDNGWAAEEWGLADLVGRTISAVYVDTSKREWMRFDTDFGPVTSFVEGDCCSESWFEELTGLSALVGHPVVHVTELPMRDENCGEMKIYGYRIETAIGSATLAFRNSSNGYYGGWMSTRPGLTPGIEWEAITTDNWSA